MVVKIHPWRITWRYLIVFAIVFIIAFFACFGVFFDIGDSGITVASFGISQGIFIGVAVVSFVLLYLLALNGQKYIIESKYFIVKRLAREYQYDYSSILFVDKEQSEKKKMVIIFTIS